MVSDQTIPKIKEFTKIPINLFFAIGICIVRWEPNEKPLWLQCSFFAILAFHFTFDLSAMVFYLIYEPMETSLKKTAFLIFSTFVINSAMKLFCILFNLNKISVALKGFEKLYPKTKQQRLDYDLDVHLTSMRRYNRGLAIVHFTVTTMFNLFPLIQCITLYYTNEERLFLYEFPFPLKYTFDTKQAWGYGFAYLTQCTGSYSASCAFLGSDILLITCVHLINMYFRSLAKSIREFKPTGTLRDLKKLEEFISFHNDILRSVELVDEIFNMSVFLNYMCTVSITCLIGFQLVVGTEFLHVFKFLSFLLSGLLHVYFVSTFGTDMMTLSADISEAFMHHAWYDAHEQYRRALTLPIARAQKPVHLNAFKFFIISMESFKSLISVSYQFFTLIKTSYVDE